MIYYINTSSDYINTSFDYQGNNATKKHLIVVGVIGSYVAYII